jgi:hypothetical protein
MWGKAAAMPVNFTSMNRKNIGALLVCSIAVAAQAQTAFKDEATKKYGFRDGTRKTIIAPKYNGAIDFSGGLAAVNIGADEFELGGKWGFIDKTGKEIIPPKYDFDCLFINGKAKVTLNGKDFFIDKTGREVP